MTKVYINDFGGGDLFDEFSVDVDFLPRHQDLLVNCCKKNVPVHLAQELVQLLLIALKFMALLNQKVLDTLSVDRPMRERHFRVLKALLRKVKLKVIVNCSTDVLERTSRWSHDFRIVLSLVILIILEIKIYVRDVCLK